LKIRILLLGLPLFKKKRKKESSVKIFGEKIEDFTNE
jgi:hypothetical protein